jgi:hypothetical protein
MGRYFFDIVDGGLTLDQEGRELAGADQIAEAAMSTLLEIAKLEVVANNEREISVTVRDEEGEPIYRTSLLVTAGWLAGVKKPDAIRR